MRKYKLIIADDHSLFIDGLIALLGQEKEFDIIFVAKTGEEVLDYINKCNADILLLDINMPKINGLDVIRFVRQMNSTIKIIMLSTYGDQQLIDKAAELGANGYLLKNVSKKDLINALEGVLNGSLVFPNFLKQQTTVFGNEDNFLKQYSLTKREKEILLLIKDGKTNQQMADTLFLSIYTVETHRKNIMQKLNLNSPTALIKFIVEYNI